MQHWSRIFDHARHFFTLHVRMVRYLGIGVVGVIFLMVGFQLVYPRDRLLPGVAIGGHDVGGKTVIAAKSELNKAYHDATLKVTMDNKTEQGKYREIGINIEADKAVEDAAQYSVARRLIPFSMFATKQQPIPTSFDDERLHYFAEQIAKKYSVAAVNASIKVEGDDVKLVPAQRSKEYRADDIVQAIERSTNALNTTISLAAITTDPPRKDGSVQEALNKAQKIVGTPMALTFSGQQTQVPKETVASWLTFPEDPKTQKLTMSVNNDAIRSYVNGLQSKAYKAPGVTTVTMVDGQETGRSGGGNGQGLDVDGTTTKIADAISKEQGLNLALSTVTIPAKVIYQRSYTGSQAGLSALVKDLGSGSFSIAVAEVGGKGRSASSGGGKQYEAASTYKLYVAYAVIKRVESGAMGWGDQITNGKDASACFEAMIVVSDNPCAKAFGEKIGWGTIDDMMRDVGLASTSLNRGFYTTANDLALYLQKLANGSLMSTDGSSRLLDCMKRQVYRSGIPAGTKVPVADKVGFIGAYLHDAGIVYSASGTYVMVFMTSGSSWSAIANASSQIHGLLNR